MTTIDKHVNGTICWVDLMTTNAEKSREFYAGLLGWSFEVGGPETGHYSMANLGRDHVAGLGQIGPEMNMPSSWTVYFASENLDDTVAKVKANGGSVMMGPMDVMEEGRMAVFTDPTSAVFGVWQAMRHIGAQRIDEPGAMTWYEVNTPDAPKSRDFYCKVFGLEPQRLAPGSGPPTEYYTLHKGPKTVSGVLQMTKEWAGVPPHWMAYFAVEDTDAAVKKIAALGGRVGVPAFDTPYGRIAVVTDPTGAVFSIVKPPKR